MLLAFQCESSNIEDCIKELNERSERTLNDVLGVIESAKISLNFGAFMNLMVIVSVSPILPARKVILADYSSGKGKEDAISKVLEKINGKVPENAGIVDFELKTYTTPVTRRTYAVGVVVYNVPMEDKPRREFTVQERRQLLAGVLRAFNYNPKVLNISEVARVFGVSRDSIYYDIEQILKEVKTPRRTTGAEGSR